MVQIFLNNKYIQVSKNITVLEACKEGGVEIPRFCYHEKLSIAGNCRMCLVEITNSPKPIASCALPVLENMQIFTNTTVVRKAREGVIEFLLANHPLDCPICDQGGECDLQDQAMIFGGDRGRYYEYKRAVEDKNCGILVKTLMTRCIHCTRCVRFLEEVAGISNLGVLGRGSSTEIGTYVNSILNSELSANVIDLCPVGALTSKPYAYKARSWELRKVETICVLDSYGTNICIDLRGNDILRILPKYNKYINQEWITDITRFSYDTFKVQRILRISEYHKLNLIKNMKWLTYFKDIKKVLWYSTNYSLILGNFVDLETLYFSKFFLNKLGYSSIFQNIQMSNIDFRYNYIGNKIEDCLFPNSIIFLVGLNLRVEMPLLNIKLREKVLNNNVEIISIGGYNDLTYSHKNLGLSLNILKNIIEGKHYYCLKLKNATKVSIFFGPSVLIRKDFDDLYKSVLIFKKQFINCKIKLINSNVSDLNAYELGCNLGINDFSDFSFKKHSNRNLIHALSASNFNTYNRDILKIYYQGTHGTNITLLPFITIPTTHYIESNLGFFNFEGYYQKTKFMQKPPRVARDGWKIFKSLGLTFLNISNDVLFLSQLRIEIETKITKLKVMLRKSIIYFNLNFYNLKVFKIKYFNKILVYYLNNKYLKNTILKNSLILKQTDLSLQKWNKTSFFKF